METQTILTQADITSKISDKLNFALRFLGRTQAEILDIQDVRRLAIPRLAFGASVANIYKLLQTAQNIHFNSLRNKIKSTPLDPPPGDVDGSINQAQEVLRSIVSQLRPLSECKDPGVPAAAVQSTEAAHTSLQEIMDLLPQLKDAIAEF